MAKQRILIVDFMHLVHTYLFAPYDITGFLEIDGEIKQVSVKLHRGIISAINKWSRYGKDKVIICMDRPVPARKAYFNRLFTEQRVEKEYKKGRKHLPDNVHEAVDQIVTILREIGVPVCIGDNYEADDLVFACITMCKEKYPDTPIDVITNDADLLPLVDDQVSVFIKSTRFSSAMEDGLLKKHYIQITPENFEFEVNQRGAFKKFKVPYNTILLHKLLRGDPSDNIPPLKGMTPKKYNKLIEDMENDGVDFANTFRYGVCMPIYTNKETGEEIPASDLDKYEKGTYKIRFPKPQELIIILNVLSKYLDEDSLKHVEGIYKGINLNQPYAEIVLNGVRLPATITLDPASYEQSKFKSVLEHWNLKLN